MPKSSRDNVENANNGWDATVNNNFIRLFDRPIPIFLHTGDETDIATSFPPASYEESLVVIDDTQVGLTFYVVDKNHPSAVPTWVHLSGRGSAQRFVTRTATVALQPDDLVVIGTPTADATYVLPPAAQMQGQTVRVKNLSMFILTLAGDAAELIDGANTQDVGVLNSRMSVYCDGTAWYILSA